jgi:hypothetical protein
MWELLAAIAGTLLFTCGPTGTTSDVYLKDPTGAVRRLTVTPEHEGVRDAVWLGDRVVTVGRESADLLAVRDVDTPPTSRGRLLERQIAGNPAVSNSGVLAYTRLWEDRRGRLSDEVVRVGPGGRKRALARRRVIWDLIWVRGRLFALSEIGRPGRMELVEVSRKRPRTTPLHGTRVGRLAATSTGRIAYSYGPRRRHRMAIMRLDGAGRRAFRSNWYPLAWAPDGGRILVQSVGSAPEIGLMDPGTGEVQRLGRLDCGFVISAQWTVGEARGVG